MYVKPRKTYSRTENVRYVATLVVIFAQILYWCDSIWPTLYAFLMLSGFVTVIGSLFVRNYEARKLKMFSNIVNLVAQLRYSRGPRYLESYSSSELSIQEMFFDHGLEKVWLNSRIVLHKWNFTKGEREGFAYILRPDSIERSVSPEVRISLEELSNLQELLSEAVALKKMSFTF